MKPKFALEQTVQTATGNGVVKEIAPFKTHFEYLVEFKAGKHTTASWFHEDKLSAGINSNLKSK